MLENFNRHSTSRIAITRFALAAAIFVSTASAQALVYQIDDGTDERGAAPFRGGALAWLNSFQVEPGGQRLTSIEIDVDTHTEDYPIDLYIWLDPTNDGNPVDATVARSVQISTQSSGGFFDVPIVPLDLPVGSWFFAGGIFAQPVDAPFVVYPVTIDTTEPVLPDRSFLATWPDDASLADPNNLSEGAFFFGPESDGNYLIRVHAVPEAGSLGLLAAGLLCTAVRGRRSYRRIWFGSRRSKSGSNDRRRA